MHLYLLFFLVAFSVVLLLLRWLYPPAWLAWLKFIQPVGEFMARLIIWVFYLIFAGPFALIVRRSRPQAYGRHPGTSYWEDARPRAHDLPETQQQF
ncbi:hypothetical protein [Anthocerotibacter panamensis]|uniref:hypothetical protein n=1 Tax=Anthocerotibacter panamensis TaxID=2857077 RepID=UPI001C4081A8|nr:hypothetical protein [Anthocerotibacter panamensis]